ncbi:MAG: PLP-dependent aminotransferase family protein [Chloroflexi bacterium]|nr:PLP-dependent aminotransferase family protein [Chloroflexota bacterium]
MSNLQTTQLDIPESMIDFGVGQPSLSLLPVATLKEAAAHRLGQGDASILQYGAEQGDGYFRLALAQFLMKRYSLPVEADHLLITSGASQALDLICTRFTQPGDTIFVEEPTYFLALLIFRDYRLNVVGIPMDENGLIMEALEEKLAHHRPVFLYTIPTFHNPSAATLSAARREWLVALSQRHNFLIVADEVYHMLDYTAAPPLPLAAHIHTGSVISLGSFSKITAPGLRLGWLQAAPARLDALIHAGLLESGGGLNPFTSGVMRSMIELGRQDECLAHLKTVYHQRSAALSAALRQHLPAVSFAEPGGGFFIWLRLPEGLSAQEILAKAWQHDVSFQPGVKFSSTQGLRNYLRLSFAYYEAPELIEGVNRLAQVII